MRKEFPVTQQREIPLVGVERMCPRMWSHHHLAREIRRANDIMDGLCQRKIREPAQALVPR